MPNQSAAERKAYLAAYRARPDIKTKRAADAKTPERIAQVRAYQRRPEFRAMRKRYRDIPENRERQAAHHASSEGTARRIANHENIPIEIPDHPRPERCECCGEIAIKTLHLDHCHDTGRFRGWICHGCNTGVGRNDSPKLLRLRALYLEKPLPDIDIQWAHPNKHKRIAA